MINIIRASLFKLFRDRTFQVTAIIGSFIAILIVLIQLLVQACNGQSLYLSSSSPSQNFGLTIPINLIVFTVGEFTYGTIRNKVIAGLSKTKLYFGLFFTGLVFTFILYTIFAIFSVGLASIIGGFSAEAIGGVKFVLLYLIYVICAYVFITALSIFFASLVRQIGGSISIVIILLVFLSLIPLFTFMNMNGSELRPDHWSMWINPLYMVGLYGNNAVKIIGDVIGNAVYNQTPQMIAAGILTPLAWGAIFFISGLTLFNHQDIK